MTTSESKPSESQAKRGAAVLCLHHCYCLLHTGNHALRNHYPWTASAIATDGLSEQEEGGTQKPDRQRPFKKLQFMKGK